MKLSDLTETLSASLISVLSLLRPSPEATLCAVSGINIRKGLLSDSPRSQSTGPVLTVALNFFSYILNVS